MLEEQIRQDFNKARLARDEQTKKALEAIEGVTSAEADHEKGIAEVVMDKEISDEVLKGAVEARDYKVTGIEKA